jgi:hypothetical protein
MKTKIYVLSDNEGRIRYVGKTIKPLAKRLAAHLSDARKKPAIRKKRAAITPWWAKSHRVNWIRALLDAGVSPVITLAGEYDGDGNQEERAWIKYFRGEGCDLVNGTDGGDGANGADEDFRRRMRLALLGNKHKDGHNEKLREAAKKYWSNPDAHKRQAIASYKAWVNRGGLIKREQRKKQRLEQGRKKYLESLAYQLSPEGREESRQRALLQWKNKDIRAKLAAKMKLVSRSLEWRRKNSERQKAFYATPEGRRIKIEAAHKCWANIHKKQRRNENQTQLAI